MGRSIKRIHGVVGFFLAMVVAGCNTTTTMEIPQARNNDLVEITKPTKDQATFVLSKVVANIRRGTTIAHYPAAGVPGVEGTLCNYSYEGESTMEWGTGSRIMGDWRTELGEVFYEVMSSSGLNVAGDPKDLFDSGNSALSAEYLIGARIKEIRGNICAAHSIWTELPLNKYSGEMFIDVEWTVFAGLSRREVLKITTQGYYKQKQPKRQGVTRMFHESFASATENFANDPDFIRIALRETPGTTAGTTAGTNTGKAAGPEIVIKAIRKSKKKLDTEIGRVLPAVVTVRLGGGHGSGFLISEDGLILTNAHVVGKSRRVTIVLNNGLELVGQVERRDEARDVALIRVGLRAPGALPLRLGGVRQLEKVYVIGSPQELYLQSTVTTGIVSALRKFGSSGLRFIQSDAAISSGNSGGPLLDEYGNVIGISVLSFVAPGSENLNMFIPIGDALQALNIRRAE